jgi:D-ribose pyranose/furanose isomerase RbsD
MMGMLRNMSMQQITFYNEYTQNHQAQNARIEELYTNTNDLRTYVTTRFDEMQAQMHGYYQPNPPPNPDNMDE